MNLEKDKPVIKFVARHIYGKVYLKPNCDKSEALIEILSSNCPRSTLDPKELTNISRMGFKVSVTGDVKYLKKDFKDE